MKKEKKMLCDGDPEPDIVKEGKASLMVLALFVCAILVCALILGLCYGIYELVNWLVL